jgi:hypothetical protein
VAALRQRIKIPHYGFDYVRRINHLQRAILTNQLFRLAPQRLDVFWFAVDEPTKAVSPLQR